MFLNFTCRLPTALTLAAMLVPTGAFTLTLAPLSWVVLSEIFPNRVRGKAMSMATCAMFASSYVTVNVFPDGVGLVPAPFRQPGRHVPDLRGHLPVVFAVRVADAAGDQGQDPGGDRRVLAAAESLPGKATPRGGTIRAQSEPCHPPEFARASGRRRWRNRLVRCCTWAKPAAAATCFSGKSPAAISCCAARSSPPDLVVDGSCP